MFTNEVCVKVLWGLLVLLSPCIVSAQEATDPFALLFDAESEVRLHAWTEIVKMESLTATQIDRLLAPIAEYRSTIPERYLHPADGVALSIDLLGRFQVASAIPELMRVKSFAVFEAALCGAGSDEIHIFSDHFIAATALVGIGDPSLCEIEAELASGAPTELDAQLDGLIYSWIAGKERTLEFLESGRAAASEQASEGYDLALEVVENYHDAWCFDGARLAPPGTPITIEEIMEEYKKRQDETVEE